MACHQCGHPLGVGARFCAACGTAAAPSCSACGATVAPAARFCANCGAALGSGAPPAPAAAVPRSYTPRHLAEKILRSRAALVGERKAVTVLFADIRGSLELAGRMDPEAWHHLLDRYFALLSDGVHRYEGTVNQYTGDGIMALFGAPLAHEDHAQRACHAALHLRERLRGFADELRASHGIDFGVRIGLNSGEVVVGRIGDDLRMDYTAQGHTVGIAQRIEQLAAPGQVCLGESTRRLVDGYFDVRETGRAAPGGTGVEVYELLQPSVTQTRFTVAQTRGLSGFVGREGETRTLVTALEQAREGHGQVVGVVGEPGIGKSRLCYEFVTRCRADGIPVHEARCLAHGRNIPFAPILELFRAYFAIAALDAPDRAREKITRALAALEVDAGDTLPILFDFMGVANGVSAAPAMDADARQRRLVALLRQVYHVQAASGRSAVVLIDDVHWIDPASDAFLAQMVEATVEQSSNLLLLNFRPEYQAPWMRRAYYQQLPLAPLAPAAISALVERLLGRDPACSDLAPRIMRWSGGNPFYTEELVRELIDAGHLAGAPGAYRLMTSLEALPVPSNVRAVLAARIDRLDEPVKLLLQTAAVIGKEFAEPVLRSVVEHLMQPPGGGAELEQNLRALLDGDFIHVQTLHPVYGYAFKHPLTQEVALGSQLSDQRARAHAAVAEVLETTHAGDLDEHAALLAHHHEQAGNRAAAAHWHRRAAEWAGLKDINAALHHWQKVRELARSAGGDAEATALTILSCTQALAHGWRLGASASHWAELFAEGCAAAERAGDLAALARLNASYSIERALNQGFTPDYVHYSSIAVAAADRSGDLSLRCGTRVCLVLGHNYAGSLADGERVADELIELADGNLVLGTDVTGFSALLTGRFARQRIIAFRRDPATALIELPVIRQVALDAGYPEQALWTLFAEAEIRFHAGRTEGAPALAQAAARLSERLGVGNELMAALALCSSLACGRDWNALEGAARAALRLLQERRAMVLAEAFFSAHAAVAQLERGDPEGGRATAAAGVEFIRRSKCLMNVYSYAVLARAQLALDEPAADIVRTLDEYAAILTATGFALLEGELHELRARLARRDGDLLASGVAAAQAHAAYTRFDMTAQAARVRAGFPPGP